MFDPLLASGYAWKQRSDANTHSQRNPDRFKGARGGQGHTDPHGHLAGFLGDGLGKDHAELVPAVTSDDVAGPHVLSEHLSDMADHLVADRVTISVIDDLELVQVGQHQSHGAPMAVETLEFRA